MTAGVAGLFALTLFVSAGLLFLVQPMVGRMVLPLLGGAPAVWNTCLVFFQATLLAGYAYAHLAPARLGLRRHAILHLGLLLVPLLVLPLSVPAAWGDPDPSRPLSWLLALLVITVGLPFFIVATSAPLLQKWFADTSHPAAGDPYFLYAASNLGSMLALLSYPFLVEPTLALADQTRLWAAGYVALVVLIAGCAMALFRGRAAQSSGSPVDSSYPAPGAGRRFRWMALAFVPSSLLLSVTTYLTTDVAAIPLLWVVPLALYLLTFIVAFARRRRVPLTFLSRWMPLLILLLVLSLLAEATEPIGLLMLLHLLGLLWIGLLCHGELARDRPATTYLTEYYLWISAGGVLGGLFVALLAPLLFSSVVEYPLVLVAACLLRPSTTKGSRLHPLDVLLPLGVGVLTAALVLGGQAAGVEPGPASVALMFLAPAALCYIALERPLRFGLAIAALLLAGSLYDGIHGRAEYRTRSFFGVHRITLDPTRSFRTLVHGNTVHGRQQLDDASGREPLTYYHRTGPIGRVFAALDGDPRLRRVGVVGLGAGAMAAYARPGQQWTFFEIDPAVVTIARDSGYFTFLKNCRADDLAIVLGDARLTIAQTDERFGLLVIDAFSSDAIPWHLLTREALAVYRNHLAEGGILAFNISNRYLDLEPVLAALAADADLPSVGYVSEDLGVGDELRAAGKAPSIWVVLAADDAALGAVRQGGAWTKLRVRPGVTAWRDDYSNILDVFRWK